MQELRIFASHNQFYVMDSDYRGDSADPSFWTQETYHRRLAIGYGLLGIGTGTYGVVTVRAEEHRAEPPLDLAEWDHITECNLEMKTQFMLIMGCLDDSGLFFKVSPGTYRVHVCHANLEESEQEVSGEWEGDFGDWYLVQFWPSAHEEPTVLKQREQPGQR
jgi:hypothetical protein